jgi:hypothetical protein
MKGETPQVSPDLEENSRVPKLKLNRTNFPWLLNPRWNASRTQEVVGEEPRFSSERLSRQDMLSPPPDTRKATKNRSAQLSRQKANSNRSTRSLSQTPSRGRSDGSLSPHLSPDAYAMIRSPSQNLAESFSKQISPPSSEDEYVIPELHDYIWIQDRDPGNTNLLVLNISKEGTITCPIVAFDSHHWQDKEFCQLVPHESYRWHSSVDTRFLSDKYQKHYLRKLILEHLICPSDSGIQLCAILPLDKAQYQKSLRKISEDDDVFRPIEDLLNIPDLLQAIKKSADKWCLCGRPNNEYSPEMVLCDNTNCEIGWYHLECLDIDEGDESGFWLCQQCEATDSSTHHYSEDSDINYDEGLYEESTDRIQLTKAIASVWAKHKWPERDKLLKEMEKISRRIDFDSSVQHPLQDDANSRERNPPGCWAVPRTSKKKPKMIKVAPSGMVFGIGEPSSKITTALRRSRPTRTRK